MKGTKTAWTKKEIEYLKKNYGKVKTPQICVELDRTIGAVVMKAREMNLTKTKKSVHRKWTESEKVFLAKSYKYMEFNQICTILGRTKRAVRLQASKQGLRKKEIYVQPENNKKNNVLIISIIVLNILLCLFATFLIIKGI